MGAGADSQPSSGLNGKAPLFTGRRRCWASSVVLKLEPPALASHPQALCVLGCGCGQVPRALLSLPSLLWAHLEQLPFGVTEPVSLPAWLKVLRGPVSPFVWLVKAPPTYLGDADGWGDSCFLPR